MQYATAVLVLLVAFAQPGYAVDLIRGPYLQQLTQTGITVKWRTDTQTDAIVRYGAAPGSLSNAVAGTAAGVNHQVTLNGLTPATRYYQQ